MPQLEWQVATGGSRALLSLYIDELEVDPANNRSRMKVALVLFENGNQTASSGNQSYWAIKDAAGNAIYTGSFTYNFNTQSTYILFEKTDWWVGHGANGAGTFSLFADISPDAPLTSARVPASGTANYAMTDFQFLPYAPGAPSLSRNTGSNVIGITSQVADGRGLPVTDYQWRVSSDNSNWSGEQAMGTGRFAQFTGNLGWTYWLQTRAYTSEGWSGWSGSSALYIPNVPTAPAFTNPSRSGANVNVQTGGADGRGAAILEYQVIRTTDNQASWSDDTRSGSDVWFGPLTLGASYRFSARARNEMGWGDWRESSVISIPNVPAAPASINVQRTARNVTVTSGSADGRGEQVTGYFVQYSTNGGSTWSPAQAMSSQSYTFSNLAAALTYRFRVYAVNAMGNSAATVSGDVFVPAGGKRWDGTQWVSCSIAKRWTGTEWVDITIARRFDGTAWVDLS